jgi:hypothetical protein
VRVPARFDLRVAGFWLLAAVLASALAYWDASDLRPPERRPSARAPHDAGPVFYDVAEIEAIYGLPPLDAGRPDAGAP